MYPEYKKEEVLREKRYLGDGLHYFIIRPDKWSGEPLAELFDSQGKSMMMVTIGNRSIHNIIDLFEIRVMHQ